MAEEPLIQGFDDLGLYCPVYIQSDHNLSQDRTTGHLAPDKPPASRGLLHRVIQTVTHRFQRFKMNEEDAVISQADQDACAQEVLAIFPDICPEYLRKVANENRNEAGTIINFVIDQEEAGKPYQRRPKDNILKRKRNASEDPEERVSKAKRKYDNPERRARSLTQIQFHRLSQMLCADFPILPEKTIKDKLAENSRLLLPTYLALYEMMCAADQGTYVWRPFVKRTGTNNYTYWNSMFVEIAQHLEYSIDPIDRDISEELQAARSICAGREKKRLSHRAKEEAEKKNYEEAKAEGLVRDCECCFMEFAINRLVHCDGQTLHFFCILCARRQAESLIGLSKYELLCMSTDDCPAGFSHEERSKFLDDSLTAALDRIEQEAVIRIAGIENLATCPFCPFAAEYPPVEEDKEFRCQNPECRVVSCRLCNTETHVPNSCEEAARETAYSARRDIEEAMSAAMIRKCNKCSTPFIKEHGCNKMTCTRSGCKNVQCYVCSKSCDYTHFNDPCRGGRAGNCPLFDNADVRHDQEVRQAERQARKRIEEENPDINSEFLQFKVSEGVSEDERRRANNINFQGRFVQGPEAFIEQRMQQMQQRQRNLQRNNAENLQMPIQPAWVRRGFPVRRGPLQGEYGDYEAARIVMAQAQAQAQAQVQVQQAQLQAQLQAQAQVQQGHAQVQALVQAQAQVQAQQVAPWPEHLPLFQHHMVVNRAQERAPNMVQPPAGHLQQVNGDAPANANWQDGDAEFNAALNVDLAAAARVQAQAIDLANANANPMSDAMKRAHLSATKIQARTQLARAEMAQARVRVNETFARALSARLPPPMPRNPNMVGQQALFPGYNHRALNLGLNGSEQEAAVRRSPRLAGIPPGGLRGAEGPNPQQPGHYPQ